MSLPDSLELFAEKLQRRNRELSILNAIAQALNGEADLDQALLTTLEKVAELFDLHTGWIWLLNPDSGEPYLAASQNLPPGLTEDPRRMQGSCYCLDTFHSGDLAGAANINVVTCTRLKYLSRGTRGLRYHASIPLYAHGKKMGVLNVSSSGWQELSEDDLQLLHTIGDVLGIAVERARLSDRSVETGVIEERNRLAREIHDTLAQGLAGITLHLETADALLEQNRSIDAVREAVELALSLAQSSLEEARRSVLDLRAAPLEGRSLDAALQALAVNQSQEGVQIFVVPASGMRPLPVRIEAGLYRIAQEALTNALRHAQASQIVISLENTHDEIVMIVEDNGRGFDPNTLPEGHYGLIGLNERAKLLGGKLTIESSPGRGARLRVQIPQ